MIWWEGSCMRIFKSIALRRVVSLVVLVSMLLTVNMILGELLTPVSYADYFVHDLETIEKNNEQVDMVFVGASRVYRTFVPEVFEEELDMECVINAASSSQPICASYYQLKYLVKKFHPENVVLGLTWNQFHSKPNQQSMLIVYDRLPLAEKMEFALNCFEGENLLYALYPYRFRINLSDIESIYEGKQNLVAHNYEPNREKNEYYADTGFVYTTTSYETGTMPINGSGTFSEEKIREVNLAYLDACVELCKENNIKLHLVTAPSTMMRMYRIENYQGATDYFTKYAEENGLTYHNLNYLVDREQILPDELMYDYNHVNGEGAYVTSEIYADILKKDWAGIDTSEYFYDDLEEMKESVNRIVAVGADISFDENNSRLAHIEMESLQNDDVIPYYQIEISVDEGETFVPLVEWTQEAVFDIELSVEEEYELKVRAMTGRDGDAEAYQIYRY